MLGWLENLIAAGAYTDCALSLTTEVGPPPSLPLQPIADAADEMCASFARYRAGQGRLDEAEARLRQLARIAVEHVPGTTRLQLPQLAELTDESREEPTFAAVAEALSGKREVIVRCWSPRDWARVSRGYARRNGITFGVGGFTSSAERSIDLSPDVCGALARIQYGNGDHVPEESYALGVLAHESMHLLDEDPSEAQAECRAMQRIVRVATMLGMPADVAQRRASFYFGNIYSGQYPEYQSPDCRADGPLDESPGGPWP